MMTVICHTSSSAVIEEEMKKKASNGSELMTILMGFDLAMGTTGNKEKRKKKEKET